jgi:serine phosphatase RsbU (regulator of sigma subunit)
VGVLDREAVADQIPAEVAVELPRGRVRSIGAKWLFWLPAATLVIGVTLTAVLAIVSHSQYTSNEKRLLRLRVRDASSLLNAAVPTIQTPLASAAELADATHGNAQKFRRFVAPYVGKGAHHQFISISLWRTAAPGRGPVAVVGARPHLPASSSATTLFFARAAQTSTLSVIGLLHSPMPVLGYAFATPGATGGYAAYGENPLPANRRSRLAGNSEFAGLDYAIYLGATERPKDLLVTSVDNPPLRGTTYAQTVPFGTSALTLVMSSRVSLEGALPRDLPWIITVAGILLSIAAAAGTLRLTQRRRDAERLAQRLELTASENQRLYAEQRSIAQTLQHALLPDSLPRIPGVETSALYVAGEQGVEIGGDWYDVIELEGRRLLLVVGDVSGRGLRAATTMAALRYAIHAYAAQNDSPAEILTKLSGLVSVTDSGQLATILCALVDVEGHEISVTSAGHLPPLLLVDGAGEFVQIEVGLPIGVDANASYASTTVAAPGTATFLAFTDGLIEHRGEDLDDGLARLRAAAIRDAGALSELLGGLLVELSDGPSIDDIAILGLRWMS